MGLHRRAPIDDGLHQPGGGEVKKHPELWCSIALLCVWLAGFISGVIGTYEMLMDLPSTFGRTFLTSLANYTAIVFAVIVFDEAHD